MNTPTPLLLRLYDLTLHLYPRAFRLRYANEMLHATTADYATSSNHPRFALTLATDTLRSLLREHLRAATTASLAYVLSFALFFTFALLSISVIHQQILRRAADRGPVLLTRIVTMPAPNPQWEAGRSHIVADILTPEHRVEISSPAFLKSALIFTIVYDASGRAIGGNATLHGALPQPPQGIFSVIRTRGNDKITWQPQPGVRVALAGLPMPNGGFVLAGQSLIVSESSDARLNAFLLWMGTLCILACAILIVISRRNPLRSS